MNILNRYLIRHNLFLIAILLLTGSGIFILTELFQKIDVFLDAGHGAGTILWYFTLRLPMILARILPTVFLLSMVIQLALMGKRRELIALRAGGVTPAALFRFVCLYGLVCALFQFACAQIVGIAGERQAERMWNEEIRGREVNNLTVTGLLFTQGSYVVRVETAWPYQEKAQNILVYELSRDGLHILSSHAAQRADSGRRGWTLFEVDTLTPSDFRHSFSPRLHLDIRQDLRSFRTLQPGSKIADLALADLSQTIQRLELAGANVEAMRMEYYGRFAYAGAVLSLGLLGLVISMLTENLYLGVLLALLCNLIFYAGNVFFSALGSAGSIPPWIAAWTANALGVCPALLYILPHYMRGTKFKKFP